MERDLIPISTPGEIIAEEFMAPVGLSIDTVANRCDMLPAHLRAIIEGKSPITIETAEKLTRGIGMTPKFWLDIQRDFEERTAKRAEELGS